MRSINCLRERVVCVSTRGLLRILVAVLLASITLAATPSQAGVSWDYKLLGPLNSAQDPETGFTILIKGSGSFDVSEPRIDGGGSYTILDSGGSVIGSGTWEAKYFDNFVPMEPGRSPGEGGHLELEASFTGTGTGVLNGLQQLVIQCSMWGEKVGSRGYPWPADFVEVGSYTTHKTGAIMFNLNQ